MKLTIRKLQKRLEDYHTLTMRMPKIVVVNMQDFLSLRADMDSMQRSKTLQITPTVFSLTFEYPIGTIMVAAKDRVLDWSNT